MPARTPTIFFGHGSPLNALQLNEWTRGWAALGQALPKPRAVVSVSAHWYGAGTAVTAMAAPATIHDFGGFPRELYEVSYPARGDPVLAERIAMMLRPTVVQLDHEWGLDHGTWCVLRHVFPQADVPVIQLSIDARQPPAFHYELGRRLAPLREDGILVIGSGNIVHNLRLYAWRRYDAEPLDWALRFDQEVRRLLANGADAGLIDYGAISPDAALAVPTPDHYLPFLYVLGQRSAGEPVGFPVQGIDGGAISMLAVRIG
ncbi:MAG TPA: 4,5-DOPA dioxygenase extradiol [Steroidobacteraceae bacterium]